MHTFDITCWINCCYVELERGWEYQLNARQLNTVVQNLHEQRAHGDDPTPSSFGVVVSAEEPPGLDIGDSGGRLLGGFVGGDGPRKQWPALGSR